MKNKRYSVKIDARLVICEDAYVMRAEIVDAIAWLAQGKKVLIERDIGNPHKWQSPIGYWHVFAHDGYHLIEVVEIE